MEQLASKEPAAEKAGEIKASKTQTPLDPKTPMIPTGDPVQKSSYWGSITQAVIGSFNAQTQNQNADADDVARWQKEGEELQKSEEIMKKLLKEAEERAQITNEQARQQLIDYYLPGNNDGDDQEQRFEDPNQIQKKIGGSLKGNASVYGGSATLQSTVDEQTSQESDGINNQLINVNTQLIADLNEVNEVEDELKKEKTAIKVQSKIIHKIEREERKKKDQQSKSKIKGPKKEITIKISGSTSNLKTVTESKIEDSSTDEEGIYQEYKISSEINEPSQIIQQFGKILPYQHWQSIWQTFLNGNYLDETYIQILDLTNIEQIFNSIQRIENLQPVSIIYKKWEFEKYLKNLKKADQKFFQEMAQEELRIEERADECLKFKRYQYNTEYAHLRSLHEHRDLCQDYSVASYIKADDEEHEKIKNLLLVAKEVIKEEQFKDKSMNQDDVTRKILKRVDDQYIDTKEEDDADQYNGERLRKSKLKSAEMDEFLQQQSQQKDQNIKTVVKKVRVWKQSVKKEVPDVDMKAIVSKQELKETAKKLKQMNQLNQAAGYQQQVEQIQDLGELMKTISGIKENMVRKGLVAEQMSYKETKNVNQKITEVKQRLIRQELDGEESAKQIQLIHSDILMGMGKNYISKGLFEDLEGGGEAQARDPVYIRLLQSTSVANLGTKKDNFERQVIQKPQIIMPLILMMEKQFNILEDYKYRSSVETERQAMNFYKQLRREIINLIKSFQIKQVTELINSIEQEYSGIDFHQFKDAEIRDDLAYYKQTFIEFKKKKFEQNPNIIQGPDDIYGPLNFTKSDITDPFYVNSKEKSIQNLNEFTPDHVATNLIKNLRAVIITAVVSCIIKHSQLVIRERKIRGDEETILNAIKNKNRTTQSEIIVKLQEMWNQHKVDNWEWQSLGMKQPPTTKMKTAWELNLQNCFIQCDIDGQLLTKNEASNTTIKCWNNYSCTIFDQMEKLTKWIYSIDFLTSDQEGSDDIIRSKRGAYIETLYREEYPGWYQRTDAAVNRVEPLKNLDLYGKINQLKVQAAFQDQLMKMKREMTELDEGVNLNIYAIEKQWEKDYNSLKNYLAKPFNDTKETLKEEELKRKIAENKSHVFPDSIKKMINCTRVPLCSYQEQRLEESLPIFEDSVAVYSLITNSRLVGGQIEHPGKEIEDATIPNLIGQFKNAIYRMTRQHNKLAVVESSFLYFKEIYQQQRPLTAMDLLYQLAIMTVYEEGEVRIESIVEIAKNILERINMIPNHNKYFGVVLEGLIQLTDQYQNLEDDVTLSELDFEKATQLQACSLEVNKGKTQLSKIKFNSNAVVINNIGEAQKKILSAEKQKFAAGDLYKCIGAVEEMSLSGLDADVINYASMQMKKQIEKARVGGTNKIQELAMADYFEKIAQEKKAEKEKGKFEIAYTKHKDNLVKARQKKFRQSHLYDFMKTKSTLIDHKDVVFKYNTRITNPMDAVENSLYRIQQRSKVENFAEKAWFVDDQNSLMGAMKKLYDKKFNRKLGEYAGYAFVQGNEYYYFKWYPNGQYFNSLPKEHLVKMLMALEEESVQGLIKYLIQIDHCIEINGIYCCDMQCKKNHELSEIINHMITHYMKGRQSVQTNLTRLNTQEEAEQEGDVEAIQNIQISYLEKYFTRSAQNVNNSMRQAGIDANQLAYIIKELKKRQEDGWNRELDANYEAYREETFNEEFGVTYEDLYHLIRFQQINANTMASPDDIMDFFRIINVFDVKNRLNTEDPEALKRPGNQINSQNYAKRTLTAQLTIIVLELIGLGNKSFLDQYRQAVVQLDYKGNQIDLDQIIFPEDREELWAAERITSKIMWAVQLWLKTDNERIAKENKLNAFEGQSGVSRKFFVDLIDDIYKNIISKMDSKHPDFEKSWMLGFNKPNKEFIKRVYVNAIEQYERRSGMSDDQAYRLLQATWMRFVARRSLIWVNNYGFREDRRYIQNWATVALSYSKKIETPNQAEIYDFMNSVESNTLSKSLDHLEQLCDINQKDFKFGDETDNEIARQFFFKLMTSTGQLALNLNWFNLPNFVEIRHSGMLNTDYKAWGLQGIAYEFGYTNKYLKIKEEDADKIKQKVLQDLTTKEKRITKYCTFQGQEEDRSYQKLKITRSDANQLLQMSEFIMMDFSQKKDQTWEGDGSIIKSSVNNLICYAEKVTTYYECNSFWINTDYSIQQEIDALPNIEKIKAYEEKGMTRTEVGIYNQCVSKMQLQKEKLIKKISNELNEEWGENTQMKYYDDKLTEAEFLDFMKKEGIYVMQNSEYMWQKRQAIARLNRFTCQHNIEADLIKKIWKAYIMLDISIPIIMTKNSYTKTDNQAWKNFQTISVSKMIRRTQNLKKYGCQIAVRLAERIKEGTLEIKQIKNRNLSVQLLETEKIDWTEEYYTIQRKIIKRENTMRNSRRPINDISEVIKKYSGYDENDNDTKFKNILEKRIQILKELETNQDREKSAQQCQELQNEWEALKIDYYLSVKFEDIEIDETKLVNENLRIIEGLSIKDLKYIQKQSNIQMLKKQANISYWNGDKAQEWAVENETNNEFHNNTKYISKSHFFKQDETEFIFKPGETSVETYVQNHIFDQAQYKPDKESEHYQMIKEDLQKYCNVRNVDEDLENTILLYEGTIDDLMDIIKRTQEQDEDMNEYGDEEQGEDEMEENMSDGNSFKNAIGESGDESSHT